MDKKQILLVELKSPITAIFKIYVSNDKKRYVRRIDVLDPLGRRYARANYGNFKDLKGGGWIYRHFEIEVDNKLVLQGDLYNVAVNLPLDAIIGYKGDSYVKSKKTSDLAKKVSDPARSG